MKWIPKRRKEGNCKQLNNKMFEGSIELDSSPISLRNEITNLTYFWFLFEDALI